VGQLIKALQSGKVDITFESLNSGREITKTYTLNTLVKINVSTLSDKLIAYDIEGREWEDIERSTIRKWSVCE